jgi:DNA-binding transcriptional LysR family regulator
MSATTINGQAEGRQLKTRRSYGRRPLSRQEGSMSLNVQKIRKVQFAELIEFVVVAEYRSFTRAADQLGFSTPTLSQKIRAVEDRLGLRLLNRTTRHVAPTPAGERLLDRLRPVLKDLESALEELNEYRDRPAGHLRLAIAPAANHMLGPILTRFVTHYPDVKIEISADDGLADIISGHFDAGIQLGERVADNMIAVRISEQIQRVVVGAPTYFIQHPPPRTPEELSKHNCIRLKTPFGRIDQWQFVRGDEEFSVPVDGGIILNDVEFALRTALSGGGLLYLPETCAKAAVTAGTLQVILQAWMPRPAGGFVLYYPSRRRNPAALRCLADFLQENLRRERLEVAPYPEPRLLCA